MPNNTRLYLKNKVCSREKEASKNKSNVIFNFLRNATSELCATYNFSGSFVDFRFVMYTQVLMKEFARMLINVRKISTAICLLG